jgi:hypothetical protein
MFVWFETNRKFNLKLHNARVTKCTPIEIPLQKTECHLCHRNLSTVQSLKRHLTSCNGLHILQCPTCLKKFANSPSKSRHIKNGVCKPAAETLEEAFQRVLKENKLKDEEIEALKAGRPIIINNTTHNDNSTNVAQTNTQTNIQMNNYDKPNIAHITNEVMKRIYETSQRDPALILNETVRRIYNNAKYPENHVIKIAEKAAFSRVFKNGKEICLPVDGVIQTVMSNTGELCADRLRDCHEEGVIVGDKVVVVWKLMEILGTDDREDDATNRSAYFQSIKSAFL